MLGPSHQERESNPGSRILKGGLNTGLPFFLSRQVSFYVALPVPELDLDQAGLKLRVLSTRKYSTKYDDGKIGLRQ